MRMHHERLQSPRCGQKVHEHTEFELGSTSQDLSSGWWLRQFEQLDRNVRYLPQEYLFVRSSVDHQENEWGVRKRQEQPKGERRVRPFVYTAMNCLAMSREVCYLLGAA
jgi:hypothetical protein